MSTTTRSISPGRSPTIRPRTSSGQTEEILGHIARLLEEAGSSKERLLSVQIFLPDMADFPKMNAVWDTWVVPDHTPARATIEAKLANPAYKVEIMAIAAV